MATDQTAGLCPSSHHRCIVAVLRYARAPPTVVQFTPYEPTWWDHVLAVREFIQRRHRSCSDVSEPRLTCIEIELSTTDDQAVVFCDTRLEVPLDQPQQPTRRFDVILKLPSFLSTDIPAYNMIAATLGADLFFLCASPLPRQPDAIFYDWEEAEWIVYARSAESFDADHRCWEIAADLRSVSTRASAVKLICREEPSVSQLTVRVVYNVISPLPVAAGFGRAAASVSAACIGEQNNRPYPVNDGRCRGRGRRQRRRTRRFVP